MADMFREITRPVVRIWKEAKRSDANGNIYTETRRERGFETVHVLKGKGECLNADALRHTREETERRCGYNAANTRRDLLRPLRGSGFALGRPDSCGAGASRHNRLSVGLRP